MGREITLPAMDPGVKVTLGEGDDKRTFRLKPVTLEVEQECKEARQKLRDILRSRTNAEDDEQADVDFAEAYMGELDVVLKPLDGGKRTPSQILLEAYKKQAVTWKQIKELTDEILAEARPT